MILLREKKLSKKKNLKNKNSLRKSKEWKKSFFLDQRLWKKQWSKNSNFSKLKIKLSKKEENK